MDRVTREVMEMYTKFPYPSAEVDRQELKELANLLRVLAAENQLSLDGKRILDAGTGTGQRMVQAAKTYPTSMFTAVDLCEASLSLARRLVEKEGLGNVTLRTANLMEDLRGMGRFDLILCIGVLHHLTEPKVGLCNLKNVLCEDGAIVLWLYGEIGGRERRKRRQIIRRLLQNRVDDYRTGIQLAKDLKFDDDLELGWDLSNITERERDGLIVDAFLNINEKLYDVDSIHDLMVGSGLAGYVVSGITHGKFAYLFDTVPHDAAPASYKMTNVARFLNTPLLRQHYAALPILDKYRLLDLLFAPAGYTIMGLTAGFMERLPPNGRLRKNLVRL
ncbi:class I SAM-dependent methyltransferase [Sorangium sp. So ce131]|uniref:class I SAM-dependent methyltransferase n=1 Tax=Sorangium sp. So ce131 TaxID=3133282 RepID=UPI003F5F493B